MRAVNVVGRVCMPPYSLHIEVITRQPLSDYIGRIKPGARSSPRTHESKEIFTTIFI